MTDGFATAAFLGVGVLAFVIVVVLVVETHRWTKVRLNYKGNPTDPEAENVEGLLREGLRVHTLSVIRQLVEALESKAIDPAHGLFLIEHEARMARQHARRSARAPHEAYGPGRGRPGRLIHDNEEFRQMMPVEPAPALGPRRRGWRTPLGGGDSGTDHVITLGSDVVPATHGPTTTE